MDESRTGRPEPNVEEPQGICLDAAYDNADSRELVCEYGLIPAHPKPQRGDRPQAAPARLARAPLGRRTLPLMAQPQPRDPRPLVEKRMRTTSPALLQLASGLIAFKKAHVASLAFGQAG
ncbi:MAG: hypothetical protein ABI948_01835 [Thermoleophilia bacterium]